MAYDPTQAGDRDRVRFLVGDTADPPLMPGGESAYDALLAIHGDDVTATARAAAQGLAATYATQPTSVSSGGEGLTWGERIAQWNRIATGAAGGGVSGSTSAAPTPFATTKTATFTTGMP